MIIQTQSFTEAMLVMPMLETLDQYYPDFRHWYVNTVVPGIMTGRDQLLIATEGNLITAVSLAKRTETEVKLRCIRVIPKYQNTGLGIRLIDKTLETLEHDKPHCTVAEELFHTYSRAFINRYGFEISEVIKGQYRPGKLEYHFN